MLLGGGGVVVVPEIGGPHPSKDTNEYGGPPHKSYRETESYSSFL
jgi:hypothetical protein